MENKKELLERLEELKKQNKIVVGVEQTKDKNKKELVNIWEDEKTNVSQLLGLLYQKAVLKSTNLKIRYNYNYSDSQTITFIQSYENYDGTITKTYYNFYNIPTNLGYLDTFKISKEVLENE